MNSLRHSILAVIEKHAQKACESQYDRAVCISAISSARDVVLATPLEPSATLYRDHVMSHLQELMVHYHDPDGEYTSGKGVIGALVDDLFAQTGRLLD